MQATLIFPHQLYLNNPTFKYAKKIFLIEEPLFFSLYDFHYQKLVWQRATLKYYYSELLADNRNVQYVDYKNLLSDAGYITLLSDITTLYIIDPHDDWLLKKIKSICSQKSVELKVLSDPNFMYGLPKDTGVVKTDNTKLFFTNFYIEQRKAHKVLLNKNGSPLGGKWSFDSENRKRLPKDIQLPKIEIFLEETYLNEASTYITNNFPSAPGKHIHPTYFPISRAAAKSAAINFLEQRFANFGPYEDAIHATEPFNFHSLLSAPLNVGLITPQELIDLAMQYADKVPLSSLEGFVRQVLGWREYIRMVYVSKGRYQRTKNFFQFKDTLPAAFYTGQTGVEPVDSVIKRVLDFAYCHHIERLMVLGNIMLLLRINPNCVYQWFMELFIDSYDWVMVPNVYGMSQYADGGLMSTKPYISGSSYILKMSNFKKGKWCEIWDALYWSFIDDYYDILKQNPRMTMMTAMRDKIKAKIKNHQIIAQQFREQIYKSC